MSPLDTRNISLIKIAANFPRNLLRQGPSRVSATGSPQKRYAPGQTFSMLDEASKEHEDQAVLQKAHIAHPMTATPRFNLLPVGSGGRVAKSPRAKHSAALLMRKKFQKLNSQILASGNQGNGVQILSALEALVSDADKLAGDSEEVKRRNSILEEKNRRLLSELSDAQRKLSNKVKESRSQGTVSGGGVVPSQQLATARSAIQVQQDQSVIDLTEDPEMQQT